MKEINYTVIIPHKNTPQLLEKCINSIPNREDIQIIVVDDNSDPQIMNLNHFPGQSSRVDSYFLNSTESKGAGKARNIGLKHAKGKWLIFADSDDYFTQDFTTYLDKYLDSNYDIVLFDVESRDMETNDLTLDGEKMSKILHSVDFSDKKAAEPFWFNNEVPWGKMIRKSLVDSHNIFFDEVWASNDTMFMLKCFFFADSMVFEDQVLYCWLIRGDSLVHAKPKLKNVMARYEVDLIRNRFCIDNGRRDYTRSVGNWLLQISGYGPSQLFNALKLCLKYRISPLIKCGNWFKTISRKLSGV